MLEPLADTGQQMWGDADGGGGKGPWNPGDIYARMRHLANPASLGILGGLVALVRCGGTIMAEQAALLRQWLLLRTLSARRYGATLKELAAEMQVSEKTIHRDLATFLAAGFPVAETVVEFGRKSGTSKQTVTSRASHSPSTRPWPSTSAGICWNRWSARRFGRPLSGRSKSPSYTERRRTQACRTNSPACFSRRPAGATNTRRRPRLSTGS